MRVIPVCAVLAFLLASLMIGLSVHAARLEVRLVDDPGPFEPADPIHLELWMTELGGSGAAGFQTFLTFDSEQIVFILGSYTDEPFGEHILEIDDVDGDILLAAGIDVKARQVPTTSDALLAELTFVALEDVCVPNVEFLPFSPPSAITDGTGQAILPLDLIAFPPPPCPADLTNDGQVLFEDLLILLANWGPCDCCTADLDGDMMVGFADLLILLVAWGPCD